MNSNQNSISSSHEPKLWRFLCQGKIRWIWLIVFWLAIVLVFCWTIAAISCLDFWMPSLAANGLAALVAVALLIGISNSQYRRVSIMLLCATTIVLLILYQTRKPEAGGDWVVGQEQLAQVKVSLDRGEVEIRGIRDFDYRANQEPNKRWIDRNFDLAQIHSVWFGVDRFTEFSPIAHTFLSFGFLEPNAKVPEKFVAFSVEARRRDGEGNYSPVRGIFNHYELHYVVATERDMFRQRSSSMNRPIQLYPLRAEKSRMQKMFLDIVDRIDSLKKRPEFYHTIRNNCTNNIVAHANHAGSDTEQINMWQRDVIFPGYSDWLAYQYGLIDTQLTLAEAREHFRIDQRAAGWDGKQDFSMFVRNTSAND